jgi:hypothetical protein
VLFAFRTQIPDIAILPVINLRGLDPDTWYEIEGVAEKRSGASWMHAGLRIELRNYQSTVRHIRRVQR